MNKIALITGASSGIGYATAEKLAENNFNIIITERRKERLKDLEKKLVEKYNVKVIFLCFDIRKNKEVENAINSLPEEWKNIDILLNNAGLAAGLSTIQSGEIDDWERMIDTNIKGLLYITRKVSPIMISRKSGHIINIGSIAGKEVYANGNVYCGTKHAVDALTKAMRIDMLQYGIKVTAIHPGMVETEFSIVRFASDKTAANKIYEGLTPLFAEDIAEAVLFSVTRPSHVNINDMLIMPTIQANSVHTIRK